MSGATKLVKFSFNNIMYQQIDGLATGNPLGLALANIFVGFYKHLLFKKNLKTSLYFRYVDDTFANFSNKIRNLEFYYFFCLQPRHEKSSKTKYINALQKHLVTMTRCQRKTNKVTKVSQHLKIFKVITCTCSNRL